jgi:hypothetical protein
MSRYIYVDGRREYYLAIVIYTPYQNGTLTLKLLSWWWTDERDKTNHILPFWTGSSVRMAGMEAKLCLVEPWKQLSRPCSEGHFSCFIAADETMELLSGKNYCRVAHQPATVVPVWRRDRPSCPPNELDRWLCSWNRELIRCRRSVGRRPAAQLYCRGNPCEGEASEIPNSEVWITIRRADNDIHRARTLRDSLLITAPTGTCSCVILGDGC